MWYNKVVYDDSNNEIVIDYILDPPNTTYNDISQSTDSIISQLKTSKDQAEILGI